MAKWSPILLVWLLFLVGCDDKPRVSLVPIDEEGNTVVYDSGAKIYADHCQRCHGEFAQSNIRNSSVLRNGDAYMLHYFLDGAKPLSERAIQSGNLHKPALSYINAAHLSKVLNFCRQEYYDLPPNVTEQMVRDIR
jgi:mono/diheme cytochrome c family protein